MRERNIELSQAKELLLEEKLNGQKLFKRLGDLTLNIGNNIPTFGGIG